MKKIILAMSVVSALSASKISDKVIEFVKTITPENIQVELVKVDKVPDSKFEMVEFNLLKDGVVVGSDVFFSDGVYGTPTMLNMKESIDLKASFMAKKEKEKQEKLSLLLTDFVKENPDMIINLGKQNSNTAMVVFSDPDCPYCREHLKNIEEDLKKTNIKFVLTPLPMHENALDKSLNIFDEIKTAKTDEEKIAILRKYYQDGVEHKKIDQDRKNEYAKKVDEKVFNMGVNYTPAIFSNIKVK
ncbi:MULTISPECIES: thioredoxin fold domain-containing protein [unclassified Campylobacter]|uniref:thioredoxin fold domain-containing protein n=1 Tax=unclassified Campylobacter TaxID=2593542 RepID=UPI001D4D9287|nr:thioredoxin fold domain-containing protein [Campylobacter sp. RM9331]MBZ8005770.1 thioredoxin fold domain-containing protein [Campylobacter sp. RM9332]